MYVFSNLQAIDVHAHVQVGSIILHFMVGGIYLQVIGLSDHLPTLHVKDIKHCLRLPFARKPYVELIGEGVGEDFGGQVFFEVMRLARF